MSLLFLLRVDLPNLGKVMRDFKNVSPGNKAGFASEKNDLKVSAQKAFLNQADKLRCEVDLFTV